MIRNIGLRKASEDGVALIFALAMLALLLIMLLGFLASSLLEQRIAYSYRDDVGSRLLVRGALVHARNQLSSTSDDMLWMRNGSTEEKIIAPVVSMSSTNPARHSSSSTVASQNDVNGNPRYGYNALKPLLKRYFGPDTEPASPPDMENNWEWRNWLPDGVSMYYPEWIYYYNNPSHERMTGRMAYVIVPNMGVNLSTFATTATTTRQGIHVNEIPVTRYLSAAGLTRLNRLEIWLSPDILLGNSGLYHYNAPNQYFATIPQEDLTSNFYSGQLGGRLSGTSTTLGNYRELASLYFTTHRADAPPRGFDASSLSRTRSMSGFPAENTFADWKSFISNQFDITDSRLDQAAANAVDYSDAGSVPTSDVAPSAWLTGTAKPTYAGNEMTPYINQIVPAVEISAKYEYSKTNSNLLRSRIIQKLDFTPKPKGKLFVELINIYPTALSAQKIVLQDLKFSLSVSANIVAGTLGSVPIPLIGAPTIGDITATFSADKIELTASDVSARGYAVFSGDIDLTGSISSIDLDYETLRINNPKLDVSINVTDCSFDRAVLVANAGNVDFVQGLAQEGSKQLAGRTLSLDGGIDIIDDAAWTFQNNGESKTASGYVSFEVTDPRCNLESSQWKSTWKNTNTAIDEDSVPNFGSKNSDSDAQNTDFKNEEKDLEPDNDPAKVSTAYIRNAQMQSVHEFGLIHRGTPWQTFNLHGCKVDDELNLDGDDNPDKLDYPSDTLIFERARFGSLDSENWINVNAPSNQNLVFAPLLDGVALHNSGLQGSATTLTVAQQRSLRLWLANKCYEAADNDPAADASKKYQRYVRHSEVANVIADWAKNRLNNAQKNDAVIEELVSKIVPLVRFGEMYEYYTLFAVAQTIKDRGGRVYSIAHHDAGRTANIGGGSNSSQQDGHLNERTATYGRLDDCDLITNETWLVARLRRTISCQQVGGKYLKSCLWGRHNASCTKNVTVLESYTMDPK